MQNPRSAIQAHMDRSHEIFKLVFSGCHNNSDVWFNNSLPKLFICSEFSVYFTKTKAYTVYMHKRISMSQGILRRFPFS